VFHHHLLDLLVLDQFEQLVEFWSGVAHARPDFLVGLHHLVLLLGTVGQKPVVLSPEVAFGLLLVAAGAGVGDDGDGVLVRVVGFNPL
jgi:uncharacterized membrane protein